MEGQEDFLAVMGLIFKVRGPRACADQMPKASSEQLKEKSCGRLAGGKCEIRAPISRAATSFDSLSDCPRSATQLQKRQGRSGFSSARRGRRAAAPPRSRTSQTYRTPAARPMRSPRRVERGTACAGVFVHMPRVVRHPPIPPQRLSAWAGEGLGPAGRAGMTGAQEPLRTHPPPRGPGTEGSPQTA